MATYYVKQNDVGSVTPQTFLQDANGDAVNLTSASVRFLMAAPGVDPVVAEDAEVVDADTGEVRYTWLEGDLDDAGYYRAEWEVTYSNDAVETFPADGYISVVIREDLDVEASS